MRTNAEARTWAMRVRTNHKICIPNWLVSVGLLLFTFVPSSRWFAVPPCAAATHSKCFLSSIHYFISLLVRLSVSVLSFTRHMSLLLTRTSTWFRLLGVHEKFISSLILCATPRDSRITSRHRSLWNDTCTAQTETRQRKRNEMKRKVE